MGYMLVMGECVGCKRVFTFNADRVPSIVVGGRRAGHAIAAERFANLLRKGTGAPEIEILPGAYEAEEVG